MTAPAQLDVMQNIGPGPEVKKFVKTYPRAVVRIARPTAAKPGWGPMWRVWMLEHDGSVDHEGKGWPSDHAVIPREAALDDAHLTIGLIRQGRRASATQRGVQS
ncbi:hypothetical protein AB0K08_13695 [Citricoccus sp. NPDC055426]|uniref:hypothetical protein n=1 Tax=Citricoccus sp. NPDC055426 TaxID=3155536 RepID=UPI00342C80C1